MSAKIQTQTPFTELSLLLTALDAMNVKYTQRDSGRQVVTERSDYYGTQTFHWINGRYAFSHDSSAALNQYRYQHQGWNQWGGVNSFLQEVERQYKRLEEERRIELERLHQIAELERIEAERVAYQEGLRAKIEAEAMAKGYTVKEKREGKSIRLVLVRHVS